MYNCFPKGSEAYFAMQTGIDAMQDFTKAETSIENAFEEIAQSLDDQVSYTEEAEQERDELQKEVDKLTEELGTFDKQGLITVMSNLLVAANALQQFSKQHLVELGALNESKDSDCDSGAGSDGAGEGDRGPDAGQETSTGVTRPQIP